MILLTWILSRANYLFWIIAVSFNPKTTTALGLQMSLRGTTKQYASYTNYSPTNRTSVLAYSKSPLAKCVFAIRHSRNYGRTGYIYPNDPRRQSANECFEQSVINNLPSTVFAQYMWLFPIQKTMQLRNHSKFCTR